MFFGTLFAVSLSTIQSDMRNSYRKIEYSIPMRDGVKLFAAVYVPKSIGGKHPILLERTPYSAGPYGPNQFYEPLGSVKFREKGYVFAVEDVRGQYMSGGKFVNVRPQLKPGSAGIDESTDAYDTIDFLVKHVPDNNGAVGMLGISYPGFYAAVGAIHTHPALKAISPQAPVSDWFLGDDVHHNGAFFLQDTFDFGTWFDYPRKGLETSHSGFKVDHGSKGAYDFFLKAGSLANFDSKYLHRRLPYWNELMAHPVDDEYWRDRSLTSHLVDVNCAVLTVGGWYDAEDQWGALHDYQAIRKLNPGTANYLVMGPWFHGMWAGGPGNNFGDLDFGMPTSEWYRENIEFPFFEKYLRGQDVPAPAGATVFETGANAWQKLTTWPPENLQPVTFYLSAEKRLSAQKDSAKGSDTYVYDPSRPTPYLADLAAPERPTEYMIDDQRWAEARKDVATYPGEELAEPLRAAGPIDVDFWIATTGTDADLVVKLIDVWPADAKETSPRGTKMSGYEALVRGDIMRGKFRHSFTKPEPFVPDQPTHVHFQLNDIFHTFKTGHKMMVQVQSAWFPLVDRNPNQFEDIYRAKDADFKPASITILHDPDHPSSITVGTLPKR